MDAEETDFGELSELRSAVRRKGASGGSSRGRSGRRHTLAMVAG